MFCVFVLAVLCKLGVPLGPMPNEDIDVSNLEALEKYRVFTRYFKVAEKENKKTPWWRTYKKHITPEEGINHGGAQKPSPVFFPLQ